MEGGDLANFALMLEYLAAFPGNYYLSQFRLPRHADQVAVGVRSH